MSTDQSETEDKALEDAANPLQFRLLELFALTTIVAVSAAIFAPLLYRLKPELRYVLLLILAYAMVRNAGAFIRHSQKRNQFLQQAGRRWGSGLRGELSWKWWPLAKALVATVYGLTSQIVVAIALAYLLASLGYVYGPFSFFVDWLPVSYQMLDVLRYVWVLDLMLLLYFLPSTGESLSRARWRLVPNSVEFFEKGISTDGTGLVEWKYIEARESNLFPDRITLLIRQTSESVAATTLVVQVSDSLRGKIFSASSL